MTAPVRVLLFGALRDRAGRGEISVADPVHTVGEVWSLIASSNRLEDADRAAIRCARNLEYCDWGAVVHGGDELAFMPPVCGGAGPRVDVALTDQPIAVEEILARAGGDGDGAVASFTGRVRDRSDGEVVHALDYEAYAPMAVAVMRAIAAAAQQRHELSSIEVVHRVGSLVVGDVAIAVVTASPHREAALTACGEVVDEVKARAPIWKREHTAAGARWVDARCLGEVASA